MSTRKNCVPATLRLLLGSALLFSSLSAAAEGLLGTYYDQDGVARDYFTGDTVVQVDPVIDFNWGNGAPTAGIGADDFTVRWTGELLTPNWGGPANRDFRFRTNSDDGVRLYLDRNRDGDFNDPGELLINNWTDHGPTLDTTGDIPLTRNTRYPIMLEFYERGGGAVIELYWDPPFGGNAFNIIPTDNLFPNRPPEIDSVINSSDASNPCGDPRTLIVTWNIEVQSGGANGGDNPANYSIPGGPNVIGASLSGDGMTATLTLDGDLLNGTMYDLEASNVQSDSGTPVSPDPETYTFTAEAGDFTNGGLAASYYPQPNFGGTATERVDAQVDFDWGAGGPGITGFPTDDFSVRWEGYFTAPDDYEDEIVITSDAGFRLWIDGTQYDEWTNDGEVILDIALTPGETYPIRIEYHHDTGNAGIQLEYRVCTFFFFGFCWGYEINPISPAQLSYCERGIPLAGFGISVAPGTASTCAPLNVSIAAEDGSGNTLTAWTGTVALETIPLGTTHGDWSVVTANGTLNDATADDGQATYTFVSGDNGAVTLALSNQHADDLAIRVTDALTATASQSGTISFRDNAFVITGTDPAPLDEVPVAGRPHPLNVTMMRRDPDTTQCGAATGYAGTKNLKAWITRDGADPGGNAPALDNGSGSTALPNSQPGANNFNLDFTAGVASVPPELLTGDVGKYTLHLLDDSRDFASAVDIGGMTNMLTIRPFAISLRNITAGATSNPAAPGPGGGVFTAAGSTFAADIAGVLWQPGDDLDDDGIPDDSDDDGIPDANVDLSNNAVTVSFAHPVSVSAELNEPAGGNFGAFPNQNVAAVDFSNGVASYANFSYDEVGSIYMNAASDNYLGTADADIIGFSPVVGRFVPAYFDTEIVAHGCNDSLGFTYSGQSIANLIVTAFNSGGNQVQNYDGTLGFSRDVTISDAASNLAGSFSNEVIGAVDFIAGETAGITGVAFTLDVKETAPDDIVLRATDTDTVDSSGGSEDSTEIRSARLNILDATGPSIGTAEGPLYVETWQETSSGVFGWATEGNDQCTAFATGDFSLDNWSGNLDPGETSVANVSINAGEGLLEFSSPGPGNEGEVIVTGNVDTWLHYDWNGGGEEEPSATVRFFDIYETEEANIYIQEIIP